LNFVLISSKTTLQNRSGSTIVGRLDQNVVLEIRKIERFTTSQFFCVKAGKSQISDGQIRLEFHGAKLTSDAAKTAMQRWKKIQRPCIIKSSGHSLGYKRNQPG